MHWDRRLAIGHIVLALSLAATFIEYRLVRADVVQRAQSDFDREIEISMDNARDGLWRYALAARTVASSGRDLDWHQHLPALRDLGYVEDTVRFVSAGKRAPQHLVGSVFNGDALAAQQRARTSQQPVATGPLECVLFVPVEKGFGFATFNAAELWQDLLRPTRLSPVTIRLLAPDEKPGDARVVSMNVWGLHWRLACTTNATPSQRPLLFLFGGLGMTVVVAGSVYGQAFRRLRLQWQNEELNRLKGQFVSTVSHEFRTPLGVIVSSAGILDRYLDRLPPEERREHLANIQNSGKRMAELMESALLFSRLESDRLAFNPKPLDLAAFCKDVAGEIGVECVDVPAVFNGDEALLRHILTNLLSNAVKYSDAAVRFEVRGTTLRVSDRGIGIPELEKVGEPFWRGSNAGEIPGTGLGLFIVKRCVELHGGTLRIESEVGKGTTVTVTL